MEYEVCLRQAARKELDAFDGADYARLARVISGLETNPRPPRVKKLLDSGLWRIRTGSLRVVYSIDDDNKKIIIVRIARRTEDTYKGL